MQLQDLSSLSKAFTADLIPEALCRVKDCAIEQMVAEESADLLLEESLEREVVMGFGASSGVGTPMEESDLDGAPGG